MVGRLLFIVCRSGPARYVIVITARASSSATRELIQRLIDCIAPKVLRRRRRFHRRLINWISAEERLVRRDWLRRLLLLSSVATGAVHQMFYAGSSSVFTHVSVSVLVSCHANEPIRSVPGRAAFVIFL